MKLANLSKKQTDDTSMDHHDLSKPWDGKNGRYRANTIHTHHGTCNEES